MDGFLRAQRERGRFASEGAFTVDVSRARVKLGKYALRKPAEYVLKLVQAAVAAGSERLKIGIGWRRLTARLTVAEDPGLDCARVLEALDEGELPKKGALRHLVIGLHACANCTYLRRRCPDRRKVSAVLTESGDKRQKKAGQVHLRGIQAHFFEHLDAEDIRDLGRALGKLYNRHQNPRSS